MMGRRRWSLLLLLQVLGQTLLVISQVDSSPANKTIRIGYLWQFPEIAGAINVAIDRAQNDGLLRDYNFRYKILLFRLCCYSNRRIKRFYAYSGLRDMLNFYRAMHFSAKRGIAIACRLSVCLSVCPSVRLSVTLVDCDHIGWNSSKLISPLVSLGCSLFATPT